MRRKYLKQLIDNKNELRSYTGMFYKYSVRRTRGGSYKRTVLIKNIRDSDNRLIADHVWFRCTTDFVILGILEKGDILQFKSRIKMYLKGYVNVKEGIDNRRTEYTFTQPSSVKMVKKVNDYEAQRRERAICL